MDDPRQWHFVADINNSGLVTISDIWLLFKWLYFYPGDYLINFFVEQEPEIGRFLELSYSYYGGFLSGFISLFSWITAIAMVVTSFNKLDDWYVSNISRH